MNMYAKKCAFVFACVCVCLSAVVCASVRASGHEGMQVCGLRQWLCKLSPRAHWRQIGPTTVADRAARIYAESSRESNQSVVGWEAVV